MNNSVKPIERFSDRVENYVKYRPSYPPEFISILARETNIAPEHRIADIGSGTGTLSKFFLELGNSVYGIEPNSAMRIAAEEGLRNYPNFTSISATAEYTHLPDESVEYVTAGQAFHWFDAEKAKAEFKRILKPGGRVVLIWNDRDENSGLGRDCEELLIRLGNDYTRVGLRFQLNQKVIANFFGKSDYASYQLQHEQKLDFEALQGLMLSSSCAPKPTDPQFSGFISEVEKIFSKHVQNGFVTMNYATQLYVGNLQEVASACPRKVG